MDEGNESLLVVSQSNFPSLQFTCHQSHGINSVPTHHTGVSRRLLMSMWHWTFCRMLMHGSMHGILYAIDTSCNGCAYLGLDIPPACQHLSGQLMDTNTCTITIHSADSLHSSTLSCPSTLPARLQRAIAGSDFRDRCQDVTQC